MRGVKIPAALSNPSWLSRLLARVETVTGQCNQRERRRGIVMQVRCRRERFGLLPRFRCCRSVLPAARGQVTRGVCALRREVLLGFFSHMRRVPSLHIGPNVQSHLCSGLSQEGVTVSVTITAVEGNEGIIHCVIIE